MCKKFSLLHLVILFLSVPCLAAQSLFQVSELKVEYIAEPMGIDPIGEMTYAYGHYDSMYGRIESRWEIVNNQVIYEFVVPANTTATLYIPASYQLQNKKTGRMKKMGTAANKAVLLLQSGRYSFVVPYEH